MSRRPTIVVLVAIAAALGGWLAGTRHLPPPPAARAEEAHDRAPAGRQLWTCGMHPQVLQDRPGSCPICGMALTPVGSTGGTGDSIRIDPTVVQNMGVRVATVGEGALRSRIHAVGYLDEAQPRIHDVSLRVSGWIERLHADTEGMHVAAGAPLFDLYSPALQVAIEELIAARRAGAAGGGLAGAAAQKLRLLGLGAAQVERLAGLERAPATVSILSPTHGHVVEKKVVQGAAVEAGMQVLRIVDHSVLWLDMQIFEQDLPLVALGAEATATVTGRAGAPLRGRVVFIHPHVDPMTRTAMARIEVPNPDLMLRPGMFASVELAAAPGRVVVQAPRSAVIDTGMRQMVFLAREGGHFEPRRVTMGAAGEDGLVEIVSGLTPGEVVVTSGQFLLDAESRFREAIAKFLADGLLEPGSTPPAAPAHVH